MTKRLIVFIVVITIILIATLVFIGVSLKSQHSYESKDIIYRIFIIFTILLGIFPPTLIFKSLVFNYQATSSKGNKTILKPQALKDFGHARDILVETNSFRGKNETYHGF